VASITLKNLPGSLLRDLRKAAERDRRSLTQEVFHLLDGALHKDASVHRNASTPQAYAEASTSSDAAAIEIQVAAWRKLAGKWESDVDSATEKKALRKR
jgi:hypothetical protein